MLKYNILFILIAIIHFNLVYAVALPEEIKSTQNNIKNLDNWLKSTVNNSTLLNKEIKKLDLEIAATTREMHKYNKIITLFTQEIADLQQKDALLQAKHKALILEFSQIIKNHYILSKTPVGKILFAKDKPAKLERCLQYFKNIFINHKDKLDDILNNIQNNTQALEELTLMIANKKSELVTFNKNHEKLGIIKRQKLELNNKLAKEMQAKHIILDNLKNKERILQEQLAIFKHKKSAIKFNQRFIYPIKTNLIINKTPIITAKSGTPVYAIADGKVLFANWLKGFGLLIIIEHGNGYMSLYGHNETLLKQEGELVTQGDLISLVGKSGGQENSGLYFEIRKNGKTINNIPWFS